MCLLIFAHRAHRDYPLLVAANRDEFHRRATASSAFWAEQPQLLAGLDLEQGGTWMGITRGGRFAAVTNFRDPSRTAPAPRSRGDLPLGFLIGADKPQTYLRKVAARCGEYAGFNLLVGEGASLWYLSNNIAGGEGEPRELEAGIYGLSNAQLDTAWPKVKRGRQALQRLLQESTPDHDALDALVNDRNLAATADLQMPGMTSGMELALSAQFIVTPEYGTRSTTTLILNSQQRVQWKEQSFNAAGELDNVTEEEFSLSAL